MEKYGYKNISSRNEFEKHAAESGNHQFSYNSTPHITNYGFINWGEQKDWGVPGQTLYNVKTMDELIKAHEAVSKSQGK